MGRPNQLDLFDFAPADLPFVDKLKKVSG